MESTGVSEKCSNKFIIFHLMHVPEIIVGRAIDV